jgi:hypothetical protein
MIITFAGLLLGSVAVLAAHDHRVDLTHGGHAVAATYRASVAVTHRQVGAVAAAGRASTLRCRWTAAVSVERHARRADGLVAVRTVDAAPISGSRPGWCATHRAAIAREVAARGEVVRARIAAAAAADRAALLADLDAAHGGRAG